MQYSHWSNIWGLEWFWKNVKMWFVNMLPGQKNSKIICMWLYEKFGNCTNNDTSFMNPSSHPHLSVNQQERSSLHRRARSRLSRKNVRWPLPHFPSFLEPDEHQACWIKNFYYSEMMILEQEDGTSVSRSHVMDSWQWSTQFKIFLLHNHPTNIQAWWVGTHLLW